MKFVLLIHVKTIVDYYVIRGLLKCQLLKRLMWFNALTKQFEVLFDFNESKSGRNDAKSDAKYSNFVRYFLNIFCLLTFFFFKKQKKLTDHVLH